MQKTIAIIGGGCSGSLVAANLLLKHDAIPFRIIIIEPRAALARGIAYGTTSQFNLLNVRAHSMSAFPDQPEHLVKWLQEKNLPYNRDSFIPRQLFGNYLEEVLTSAAAGSKHKYQHVQAKAVEVSQNKSINGNKFKIQLENGESIEACAVVLAYGNGLPASIAGTSEVCDKRIKQNPWNLEADQSIISANTIAIIGSGLTAVDVIDHLSQNGYKGKFQVVSSLAKFPHAHTSATAKGELSKILQMPFSLSKKLHALRRAQENCEDWRSLMDELRPHIQKIWISLSLNDQKRFLTHLKSLWNLHRHRIAPEVADRLHTLLKIGRIQMLSGVVSKLEASCDEVDVYFSTSGSSQLSKISADYVFNCTGPLERILQSSDPLLRCLIESHSAQVDPHGFGFIANECGEIAPGLFTLGPPRRGQLWESTALREIREQAVVVANELSICKAA